MAVFKCKMCGGTLDVSDNQSVAECEYCGTKQTLPTAQDESLQKLFNRANVLRMKSEFDKAAELYEKIVQTKQDEAEAYWGLILCKYGIEYVEDPKTLSRIPTCHRASFSSVVADEDYKSALSYADTLQKTIYESEAKEIDRLQKEIIDISRNESPYDIFICYKETDADGKRTQDSVIANEIYHQLTAEGYKVFYAAITLEDKLGTEYEPYIFAALHSAKVMLVVGTKPEYFNAVWVKNEWSRYLHLLKSDRSKLLIPCYREMDPYELPEEFAHLQAQDMSKIGFINDLVRGIKKVVEKEEEKPVEKEVITTATGSASVQALLDRGFMAIEDREWAKADEFFEQALNLDAKNGNAYLGKFLVQVKKTNLDSVIKGHFENFKAEKNQIHVINRNKEEEERIVRSHVVEGYLSAEQLRKKLFSLDETIDSYVKSRSDHLAGEKAFFRRNKNLSRALEFGAEGVSETLEKYFSRFEKEIDQAKKQDEAASALKQKMYDHLLETAEAKADEMVKAAEEQRDADEAKAATEREEKYQRAVSQFEKARTIDQCKRIYDWFAVLGDYKDSKQYCKKLRARQSKLEEKIREKAYQRAINLAKNAQTIEACSEAKTELEQLNGYKDTEIHLQNLHEKLSLLQEKAEQKKKRKMIAAAGIAAGVILVIIIMKTVVIPNVIVPAIQYNQAIELKNSGNYEKAAILFAELDSFKDSKEQSFSCWTMIADRACLSGSSSHSIGIKSNGTVVAVGKNDHGQCDVSNWDDIVAIAAGVNHSLGLKSDGIVVAASKTYDSATCLVSYWTDIVAISAGNYYSLGLKSDGTVLAIGDFGRDQFNVSGWTDIVAISAGSYHSLGLKSDGTVVATGRNKNRQCNVDYWTDIKAISAGYGHSLGLKSDGTVVAVGDNISGQCNVSNWTDIVAISAGTYLSLGLKSDGTVIAVGSNYDGQCNVSSWTDIVAIFAGSNYSLGLKSDGTVVAAGKHTSWLDVSGWTNIKVPKK